MWGRPGAKGQEARDTEHLCGLGLCTSTSWAVKFPAENNPLVVLSPPTGRGGRQGHSEDRPEAPGRGTHLEPYKLMFAENLWV